VPRVGVRDVSFAGNHGLEWKFKTKRIAVKANARIARKLAEAKKTLQRLTKQYAGSWLEDKKYSLCFHVRHVKRSRQSAALSAARRCSKAVGGSSLRIVEGEFVLNILPNIGYHKGSASKMMYKRLKATKRAVPIFIGDDVTDEDAFKALRGGITVHVKNGKRAHTAARYTVKNINEVRKLLLWLSRI
jgi:trehalose-phosphatase